MSARENFDFVVIGAGPVGENVAQYATEGTDLTAALVERELVGGECSYYACMPSKALLRPVEVAAAAKHLEGVGTPQIEPTGLLVRRDYWVSYYDDASQVAWARGAGLAVVRGEGRLVGERLVEVASATGERRLEARQAVVLATGSEPHIPELFVPARPWGSRDATGVREVPPRLAIVGGGVVACEAAVWMAGLGSLVTLLVRDDRLLGRLEPFVGDLVARSLVDAGVDVRLGASITECVREDARDTGIGRVHGGPVRLMVDAAPLVADECLVATGRRPRLDAVGLDSVGLDAERVLGGALPDWLHVVGDAGGGPQTTHWGKYGARVLGEQLAAQASGRPLKATPADVPVPQVLFTDPQVGAVGLTEAQARERYGEVVVVNVPWTAAAGAALLRDDARGAAQLVVEPNQRRLLGATFVGPDAGELVHAATIAIVGRLPTDVLRHAVPCYPTASELWLRLLEELPRDWR